MGEWRNHVMAAVDSSFLPHGQGVRSWTLSTCGACPRGNLETRTETPILHKPSFSQRRLSM